MENILGITVFTKPIYSVQPVEAGPLLQWKLHSTQSDHCLPHSSPGFSEMDPVVLHIVGQDSPMKVEGSWAISLRGQNSSRAAFFSCFLSQEFFSPEVWRASVAELLGTAVLVFVLDTIVISSYQTKTATPNLLISFFIFVALTILILATFPISGGHINPVITFSAALVGVIPLSRAVVYVLAQCAGAVLGALALKAVVSSSVEEAFSLGGCTVSVIVPGPDGAGAVAVGVPARQAFCLEVICTFVLLFASVWIAFDKRQAKELGTVLVCSIIGAVAGVLVFVSTTVTATKGYAGAGMNPARCLGAALVRGGRLWNDLWVFSAGPAIACLLFYVYVKIVRGLQPWTEVVSRNELT